MQKSILIFSPPKMFSWRWDERYIYRSIGMVVFFHGFHVGKYTTRGWYVVGKTRCFFSQVLHVKMVTKAIQGATILARETLATRPCWSLEDQVFDIRSGPQNPETAQSKGPNPRMMDHPIRGWWIIMIPVYLYIYIYVYWIRNINMINIHQYYIP